ncbi:CUT domain [Popillia japonica]|uniref:CUT domain n=1 Tax=Popillia japonica TaxID=7064 RepID=A0AAW1N066_POPJA
MQPSATASIPPPGEMDIQAMQSMDWLFKKERIYLLAQFWQQRATLAEKEVTTLKEQIATNSSTPCSETKDSTNMDRHSYESEISAKEKEINQLVEEVQRSQVTIAKLHAKVPALEDQLEQKNQYIAKLEAKLESQKDYDDIKRELSILKSVSSANNSETKSIELLLERTKQETPKSPPHQEQEGNEILQPQHHHDQQQQQQQRTSSNSPPTSTGPLPPPFQNVETFGTLLGEEIVANWRRSIETLLGEEIVANWRRSIEKMSLNNRIIPSSPSAECPAIGVATPIAADSTEKSTASTPQPADSVTGPQSSPLLNGNPKSPEDNNNHHVSNNNIPISATVCPTFLKAEDLKSPYRFEEHRSYRFAEDLGMPPGSMVGRLGESLIPKGDPMEARLQEMLRFNMDKYASQNLDTLHISRRVRELLSIHNIGQRLFAKYILGLSQGTVSELLSKPKPWDKLTEKGRDSYRKMHAWSCDDNAVLLLKSLIPKKGKDTGIPTFGRPENEYPDDRIAHMLSEASHMQMKTPVEDSHSNDDSKSPQGCPSPFSKDSSQNRKLKKYENDDIPQEKVVRIYQEEFAKLMGRRIEDMRSSRDVVHSMFLPQIFSGAPMDRTQDDIRAAIDAYHRELAKINVNQPPGQLPNLGLLALQQQALAHNPAMNGGAHNNKP